MHQTPRLLAIMALTTSLYGLGVAVASDAVPAAAQPAAGAGPAAPGPSDARSKEVIVTVNGTPITRGQLDRASQALLGQKGLKAPTEPEQQAKVEAAVRDALVTGELLYQLASKEAAPADLDQQVAAQFEAAKGRTADDAAWQQLLAKKGLSAEELKDMLRRDILMNAYIQTQIVPQVKVTPEQVKAFYDENADQFKKPEAMRASHILIGVDPKASAAEKAKAREKAGELLKQVKGGADFAEVARKESSCPSAKKGGDLGEFARGQMVKPFEDAAFALDQGGLSEVVETPFGYHIIKSTGKTGPAGLPFDEVKGQIEQYLVGKEVEAQLMARIEALKKTAVIQVSGQAK